MSLKTLIIDDEEHIRKLLKNIIHNLDLDLTVYEDGHDLKSGLKATQNIHPDIVILDVQMPDGTGFDYLELTPDNDFEVIFVTAHQEYAIRAIKAAANDYILKPIDEEELKKALLRAIEKCKLKKKDKKAEKLSFEGEKIILKTQDSVFMVQLEDLIRCESYKNYTTFYLNSGKKITVSKTIKHYENLLEKNIFFKCHRSHIFNWNYFECFEKNNGGLIKLSNGEDIPLARSCKDAFFETLEKL